MTKGELKSLIEDVYEDYGFAEFNLRFLSEFEKSQVSYRDLGEIIPIYVQSEINQLYQNTLSLYNIDADTHYAKIMIEESANKILTDIYKVNDKDWFYAQREPVKIDLIISDYRFIKVDNIDIFTYKLILEVAYNK